MNIFEVFERMGSQLDVDAQVLMDYANEDNVGGYHADSGGEWPCGSLWAVEGKILYALVRFLRPKMVLEVGTHYGASATHILSALKANNAGKLTSVDLEPARGDLVPDDLKKRWKFVQAEAAQWIRDNKITADLVYEDALHDPTGTANILMAIRDVTKARVVVSHDAEHYLVGKDVRDAWSTVYGQYATALVVPSDCGIAWWIQDHD